MKKVVRMAELKGAKYVEVVRVNSTRNAIELNNKSVKEFSAGTNKKCAVRVFFNGRIGAAYSFDENYKKLIDDAIKNAKATDQPTALAKAPKLKKNILTDFKINPADVHLKDKKEALMELSQSLPKQIANLKLSYADTLRDYEFYNSDGSEVFWHDVNTGFIAWAFAKEGNKIENFFNTKRIKGGFEVMNCGFEVVDKTIGKAIEMLKAKNAKGGFFNTVVDQDLGGVFAHEAVGHACEADLVLNQGSILVDKLGEKIGSSAVSIIDDGSLKEWGWTPFDSEGVKASKTVLIKNGVLKNYLHNRETAVRMDMPLTGNGRSQDPSCMIIPRMTNTFIDKGDSSKDEMISEIKEGYYLKGSAGGQVDPAGGEFLFNAKEGYFVKDGEIQHMVKGVSLVGNVLEALHNIKLVAKDLKFSTGFCGKAGQRVPVSDGSPHTFIEKAKIGGSQ